MNPDVAILQVFPDIPTSTMKTFLSAPVKGVVLETFGAGNIPQRKELIEAIREATSRDVVSDRFGGGANLRLKSYEGDVPVKGVTDDALNDLIRVGHRQHHSMPSRIRHGGM